MHNHVKREFKKEQRVGNETRPGFFAQRVERRRRLLAKDNAELYRIALRESIDPYVKEVLVQRCLEKKFGTISQIRVRDIGYKRAEYRFTEKTNGLYLGNGIYMSEHST